MKIPQLCDQCDHFLFGGDSPSHTTLQLPSRVRKIARNPVPNMTPGDSVPVSQQDIRWQHL